MITKNIKIKKGDQVVIYGETLPMLSLASSLMELRSNPWNKMRNKKRKLFIMVGWSVFGAGLLFGNIGLVRGIEANVAYDELGVNATQDDFDREVNKVEQSRVLFWTGASVSVVGAVLAIVGHLLPNKRKSELSFKPMLFKDGIAFNFSKRF